MIRKFKIGDYVRRNPETLFPEDRQHYPPFFVMFTKEDSKASGGWWYSEDGDNWTAQGILELMPEEET